ncbi:hypothetical protein COEREDRAFT_89208 [Coemansia reversa NRRL 1564]|uniref:Uncharacterized protein n=1 Tax=Coemansia reversa (strain ATCC 12441 / NRRL 1564) TaxID=763665 RepID=A0A2G5B575_COERN|nr:hypothetical protein COEREDRAFT_89208 [Coemansia reversa NRRL 1564]|eukprot:PIA13877.1 hypothetical protein COEREDRAFT_89208 [Coemansia reversa NRRL 1564]
MGMFWPLDHLSQVVRLVGLVGIVVGCCAIADRDTRYQILRTVYAQLKKIDPLAAAEIEGADLDKPTLATDNKRAKKLESLIHHATDIVVGGSNSNAKDTRSYASDSTAFSRVGTPTQNHSPTIEPAVLERDYGDTTLQRSSDVCDTPEAVSKLGEVLSRLQLQGGRADRPSQSGYVPSPLSQTADGGSVTKDEMLMPLVTDAPHTPQQPDPAAKVIDTNKRLAPLPNPNAPSIKPSTRDGQPQHFDYTPPAASAFSIPASTGRRSRGHVELEMVEHDSYGFVSNPAALVTPTAAMSGTAAGQNPFGDDGGDHYLFVCVKCHRQSTNEVCEKICSDKDGVLRCKLRPGNGQLVEDLEDLVMPMTPKMYMDGRRKTTGRMLFENLRALHAQHEHMKERIACGPTQQSGTRECPNAVKSRLRIVPVNCLSMCHLGNVIAMSAPGKFGYQFGAMHEDDSEDMQAILQFAEDYIESQDGFTKNKTRPPRLSRNILARIPPPLPTFTSIAE